MAPRPRRGPVAPWNKDHGPKRAAQRPPPLRTAQRPSTPDTSAHGHHAYTEKAGPEQATEAD
eukprot:7623346-Alexandrium_andersonii.AAC.1